MTSGGAGGYGLPQPGRYGEPQQGPPVTSSSHGFPPQNQYGGQQGPQAQYPGQQPPGQYGGDQPLSGQHADEQPPHDRRPSSPEPPAAPRRTTSPLVWAGVVLAILLGVAALVVSLTGVSGRSTSTASGASSPAPTAAPGNGDTSEADKALCQDIGPLIKQGLQDGKDFVNLGHTGTPERDAGIPAFKEKVDAWVGRIQPILDKHANPPRYLTRMTQIYIDFTQTYADSIRPGPEEEVDKASWNTKLGAFGAAFEICPKYGVTW